MLPEGSQFQPLEDSNTLAVYSSTVCIELKTQMIESAAVPKMINDLLLSEKHKYRSFSVIQLESGPCFFTPSVIF